MAAKVNPEPARFTAAHVDTHLQIVPTRSWWALAGLGAVLVGMLLWGVFGSVATVVDGQGILIRRGGLFDAVANEGGGPVNAVLVQPGDTVHKGQVLARIVNQLIDVELKENRQQVERLRTEYADSAKHLRESDELYNAALAKHRTAITDAIAARERSRKETGEGLELCRAALKQQRRQIETSVAALEQRITAQRLLLERLKAEQRTANELEAARRDLASLEDRLNVARAEFLRQEVTSLQTEMTARRDDSLADESIQGLRVQLAALAREEVERSVRQKDQLSAKLTALAAAEDRLRLKEARQKGCGEVVSNWDGRVVEVKVDPGQVVGTGAPLVAIEVSNEPLELAALVPAAEGKKIQPGMTVELVPSTVQRAEYGYMVGKVRCVGAFAVSDAGLRRLIPNRAIINQLTSQGAFLVVEVELERDPSTPSGYRWSTGLGPDLAINSGTFCLVRVVTHEQPPVTLVLPSLRKAFGLD